MNPTNVVGRRVAATIIDSVVFAAIVAVSWFALTKEVAGPCIDGGLEVGGDCRGFTEGSSARGVWLLIMLAALLAINWLLPALRGTTPGHAAMGLRIVKRDGGLPGLGAGLVRWLMWIVDGLVFGLVAFIAAIADKAEHRRLGDRVAGTLVVHKSAAGQPAPGGAAQYGEYGGPALGPTPASGNPAPGWYDDPRGEARLRYWDGSSWTSQTTA